jgi:delta-1-pyrroline-5-carboxylate synthetase
LLPLYLAADQQVAIGAKSSQGRGGMAAKIQAALSAVKPGSSCTACVFAAGSDLDAIRATLGSQHSKKLPSHRGSLFCTLEVTWKNKLFEDFQVTSKSKTEEEKQKLDAHVSEEVRLMAVAARTQARKLQVMPYDDGFLSAIVAECGMNVSTSSSLHSGTRYILSKTQLASCLEPHHHPRHQPHC